MTKVVYHGLFAGVPRSTLRYYRRLSALVQRKPRSSLR